tara:strand:- start:44 stop:259 length:216 start_codon:yes stop_codon:yes gene_type:complete
MALNHIIIQLFNRLVGITVWVALWNILDFWIDENDMLVNSVVAVIGLIVWGLLGEYTTVPTPYANLTPIGV